MESIQTNQCTRWLLMAIACALSVGCVRWRLPTDFVIADSPNSSGESTSGDFEARATSQKTETPSTAKLAERPAKDFDWHEQTPIASPRDFTWRNNLLDALGIEPAAIAELRGLADKGGPEAAASASIQLGRIELGSRDLDMERIALTKSHTVPTRLAAIETLGRSPNENARVRMMRVARTYEAEIPRTAALVDKPIPEDRILAGVITALGKRDQQIDDFAAHLAQNAPQMACTAIIKFHQGQRASPLPPEAITCFNHPSLFVRAALLEWVAASADQSALDEVLKISRGSDSNLRFNAIRTLGAVRCAKSAARLEELSRDRNPRIAGAALAALIHQDSRAAADAVLNESRWQVKRAAAEFLAEPKSTLQWSFVERLLLDKTTSALQALDQTMARWSPESQQRCVLVGLQSEVFIVRQNALNRLEELYPNRFKFVPGAEKSTRDAQLERICASLGTTPTTPVSEAAPVRVGLAPIREAIKKWRGDDAQERQLAELVFLTYGSGLPNALDGLSVEELESLGELFWLKVVSPCDARFAAARELKNADVDERRKAALLLMSQCSGAPPPTCLLVWLDDLMEIEEDLLVWRKILSIARRATGDARVAAAGLAQSALRVETLDIRVSACEILEHAPQRVEFIALVEPLLDSESSLEQVAAMQVLAQQPELPTEMIDRLAGYLAQSNGDARLHAALVLAKQGDPRGVELLRSAAMKGPDTERRLAIRQIGETGDASQVSLLVGLLDSNPTLRQAAISSLEDLVDDEVIADAEKQVLSATESAARWKAWYAEKARR